MYKFTGRIYGENEGNLIVWINLEEIVAVVEFEHTTRTIYLRGNTTAIDVKESAAFILDKIKESQDA